ncbi:MAG: hypothetical protein IJ736_11055, partial [Firmicutes bacterium]|nr:hypothetical protein [Bacillota bacterium]
MSAFEFDCNETAGVSSSNNNRIKEECIIAFKVYDSCRQLNCICIQRSLVKIIGAVKKLQFRFFLFKIISLIAHFNIINFADFNPQHGLCRWERCLQTCKYAVKLLNNARRQDCKEG